MTAAPTLALSTWSVHRAIGVAYPESPQNDGPAQREEKWGPGTLSLMELPERVRDIGIDRLEICSFHIDRHDRGFIDELGGAMRTAGVTFQTLLIDDGDITDPVHGARDQAWIAGWIDTAAALGAGKARVICGKQAPSADVLDRAVAGLADLARHGAEQGVRVLTENWLATTPGPTEVNTVLDRLEGSVGLLADMGNWRGPQKYADLAAIFPRAENSHTKGFFSAAMDLNADDYGRCLEVARNAGYTGPHTLIYESPGDDEWRGIALERDFVLERLA